MSRRLLSNRRANSASPDAFAAEAIVICIERTHRDEGVPVAVVFKWIGANLPLVSTVVAAIATVVLAVLTAKYVRLTARLVEESQKSREPSINVDFELQKQCLKMIIENRGMTAAKNLRIYVTKDIEWISPKKGKVGIASLDVVRKGISYIAPSRQFKYWLGYPAWRNIDSSEMSVSIKVEFENEKGKKSERYVMFDFEQMNDVLLESYMNPSQAVADAILETNKDRGSRGATDIMEKLMNPEKKCTMCAMAIPREAKKCHFCGEAQTEGHTGDMGTNI